MKNNNLKRNLKKLFVDIELSARNFISKDNVNPLFVFGNQKSGTSIIAALLSKYSGQSLTLDFKVTNKFIRDYTLLIERKKNIESFIKNHKFEFSADIIKEPNLTQFIPELTDLFKSQKHIFIVRDPYDNIRSILNRLNVKGNLEMFNETNKLSPMWNYIINDYFLYSEELNYIEILAHRWSRFVDFYTNYSKNLILVRYEDFLKNKVIAIDQLAGKIDLKKKNSIANEVDVQYQRKGQKNINYIEFFGEKNLERINSICSEKMKSFNYELKKY